MNLNRQNVLIFFFVALSSCSFFPTFRLTFFAPPLVMLYYKKPLNFNLWISLLIGLFLDLISSETKFGFFSMTYCLVTWCLYSQKRYFFADRYSTLPIMVYIFSLASTFVQFLFLKIVHEKPLFFNWKSIITDFILMPFFDVIYTCLFFLAPIVAYNLIRKSILKVRQ